MAGKYKTGVFGGSFDPVHEGHTGLAEFILDKKIVDRIIFLPTACPPHKKEAVASFVHRLQMLEIAVRDYPVMEVSQIEAELSQPSYTINSLRALACSLPQMELFFILGADSLLDLDNWYQYAEILNIVNLIIAARPGISDRECLRGIDGLPGGFAVSHEQGLWTREDGRFSLWYLRGFTMGFSSTEIRGQLGSGIPPQGLAAKVFSYIKQHDLYGVNSNLELF